MRRYLNMNLLYASILLTGIWVILRENITVATVVAGFALSAGCVFFCRRFLPSQNKGNINPFRFALYLVYLFIQVYKAGFLCIGIVFKGARVKVVDINTPLRNPFLRTVLANSITLVPGSVTLDLKDEKISVLWLNKKTDEEKIEEEKTEDPGELIKGKLERMLVKCEMSE